MVTVQSTVDTGHEDMIHDAQMDFYGTRLATCSSDRSVKIFDVRDGTQTLAADLRGHEGPVWQVTWAHPRFGNILASCSYDRRVIIWQVRPLIVRNVISIKIENLCRRVEVSGPRYTSISTMTAVSTQSSGHHMTLV